MRAVIVDEATLAAEDLDLSGLLSIEADWQRYPKTATGELAERIAGAEIVLTNKVVLDRSLIEANPQLRYIGVLATGTNNVDLKAAEACGVAVTNVTGYGAPSVVQHCWSLILSLATRQSLYHRDVVAGRWTVSDSFCLLDYPIMELAGKTLLLVGYGELGQGVARIAEAFAMKVVVANTPGSPNQRRDRPDLDAALPGADVISLHCPLTEPTLGLVDARRLGLMKPSALLINTARGGLVDEAALAAALRAGQLAGAGVDVLSSEPPRADNPLLGKDIPNLILTPHSAWGSREARQRLVEIAAGNLRAFLAGESRNRLV
ncbi:D-2-hydroxyacid dehydrogenase [Aestuariirhabdus litorea]|uniref:D-2-hydroxyacid dehydrogenase n=1 Tax=Aestuariirhabdus litorea TaxID=2528527 RepID=A0A3P3VKP3_9GAMM|nr:D-2-hydroxyacid dehydrogenase [Aestuariirhabdus litorea]RRJ82306.1 D-2-hydroxyacid dehydrogenase [Aestuariirhabdus litorea]RWW92471.1 D-2-hydroxyacid dehydrogenase [Endozoicomonadaceae bacterium GTF-13]